MNAKLFVKQLLKKNDITFKEFCEMIGKSPSYIRHLLADPEGKIIRGRPTAKKIEQTLKLKPGTIFSYTGSMYFTKENGFKKNQIQRDRK